VQRHPGLIPEHAKTAFFLVLNKKDGICQIIKISGRCFFSWGAPDGGKLPALHVPGMSGVIEGRIFLLQYRTHQADMLVLGDN
jgi:hypothetical protein